MTVSEVRDHLRNPEKSTLWFFPYHVAKKLSDLAAILVYDLHIRIRGQKKKLIRDELQWTYDTMEVFAQKHLYASKEGVRKGFLALEGAALILIKKKGKFNTKKYDKKWWYHVTRNGAAKAVKRLIRYNPIIAAALDIPKAVLLEHFRHHLHGDERCEYVTIKPAELRVPYHPKTIQRHLDKLVEMHILERGPNDEDEYRIATTTDKTPVTVAPNLLLPQLKNGDVGLLVGHTGTGKTSYSTFVAIQFALAGSKVLLVTLEEPARNIVNRMYAQEFGVNYSDLHRGSQPAVDEVNAGLKANSDRKAFLSNISILDLSREPQQTHEIQDAITRKIGAGFRPDVVLLDQLERISVDSDEAESLGTKSPECIEASTLSMAIRPATLIRECLGEGNFITWVLHQVVGDCSLDFTTKEIEGGIDVAKHFDCVVGIGRAEKDSSQLRVFSMTPAIRFEQVLDADFPHMRFKPQRKRV